MAFIRFFSTFFYLVFFSVLFVGTSHAGSTMDTDDMVSQTRKTTGAGINNFVRRHAHNFLSNEVDLSGQLGGDTSGPGAVTYKFDETSAGFSTSFEGDTSKLSASQFGHGYGGGSATAGDYTLWIKGGFTQSKEHRVEQDLTIVHLGGGYRVNPDLLIGGIIQFDKADEFVPSTNTSVSGNGWMVGPYVVMKVRDNVIFDARLAFGGASNDISPTGTFTDQFDTKRVLVRTNLTGNYTYGNWKIAPNVGFKLLNEKQEAYRNSNNILIPARTIELGQFELGTKASTDVVLENGFTVTPSAGAKLLLNLTDSGFLTTNTGVLSNLNVGDASLRLDGGLKITDDMRKYFSINGFVDGVGASNYSSYGGSAEFIVTF